MLATEVLERIVRTAARAPSVRNTQPWCLRVDGDVVEVRRDPARTLRHIDPRGRESTISCGAFVDHVVVAARREGLDAQVYPLVDGEDAADGLVARVALSPGLPPSADELELSVAAVHRRTSRTALDDIEVAEPVVQGLQHVAVDAHATLVVLPAGSVGRDIVLRQVARAESLASEDLVGLAEDAAWSSDVGEERLDGVPAAELTSTETGRVGRPSRRLVERYPASLGAAGEGDLLEHGAVLALLTTAGDTPSDWVSAGRALSRLLLAASVQGLTASFATTVLENPTTRHEVVRSLGLVGAPQVLVQLGYGAPGPRSARRPVVGAETAPAEPG